MDWVPVSPLPVLTSAEGVLKTAAHPNAARFIAGWIGSPDGQKIRYATSGQAIGSRQKRDRLVAERIKANQPAIILETDKTFATILGDSARAGKMLGALR